MNAVWRSGRAVETKLAGMEERLKLPVTKIWRPETVTYQLNSSPTKARFGKQQTIPHR